jgi:hypothetical protein
LNGIAHGIGLGTLSTGVGPGVDSHENNLIDLGSLFNEIFFSVEEEIIFLPPSINFGNSDITRYIREMR